MSVYTDALPPGVIRVRIRGEFKLSRPPQGEIEDWRFFHLNAGKLDWAEVCNSARAQIFPGVALPAVDEKFEQIMAERAKRAAAKAAA